jgi:hypothetical protein
MTGGETKRRPPFRNPISVAGSVTQLYLRRDWNLLTDAFRTAPGQLGYWLMARDL